MATFLAIRKPVTGLKSVLLKVLAFLIPLGIWCAVSYCPFLWHPKIRIVSPGDSDVLMVGQDADPAFFQQENAQLKAAGKSPAVGQPSNPKVLPAPDEVARAFYHAFTAKPVLRGDPWFYEYLAHSAKMIFFGFTAAMVLAIPLGLLCGTFDLLSKLIEPFVDFIRYMPPPTFGALMIGIWGIFDAPKIAIIFIGCFFNMVLVTANTTRTLDTALLEAAQTLGASRLSLLTHVIIPGVLPGIYKDIRICVGAAWTFLTVAELIGTMSGLSQWIYLQGRFQNYDNVYAGIIMIGLAGFAIDQVLAFIGTILFPWTPDANHRVRRWIVRFGALFERAQSTPLPMPAAAPAPALVAVAVVQQPAAPAQGSDLPEADPALEAKELSHAHP